MSKTSFQSKGNKWLAGVLPLTNEEALLSPKIEGTQATVDEVLEQEAGMIKPGEKGEDIQEIINYLDALHSGHYYLDARRITLSLVCLTRIGWFFGGEGN